MTALRACRVLDLGIITAGAATAALLADLGAEVIKVESPSYRDPFRRWTVEPRPGEAEGPPPFFRMTNRGKLSASIDLKHPAGRAAFLRLVARSDVVVENFARGVLDRLGIGFAQLREANPRIILASISSQGETGPDAGYVSFGSTLEAIGGLAALTGYPGGPPVVSGIELNFPDQVVAMFAAAMVVTALDARGRQDGAVHLDLSQRELTSFLCGEAFLMPDAGDRRRGNAAEGVTVQECFRSADGAWIAVTVEAGGAARATALVGAVSAEGLASVLGAWCAGREAAAAVAALRAAGLPAAVVVDGTGVLAEEGRAWRAAMARTSDGALVKGLPFDCPEIASVGPPIGPIAADTADILRRIAGYSDTEIAALAAEGAIEIAPAPLVQA